MCLFLSGAEKLRYKQLNIEIKNNYIIGLYGYNQDLSGVMKLLNNYIAESGRNKKIERTTGRRRR